MKNNHWFYLAVGAVIAGSPAPAAQNDYVLTVATQLQDAVRDIPAARVTTDGNTVIISGEIPEPGQMDRIARLAQALKGLRSPMGTIEVRNAATISEAAKDELAKQITRQIGARGLRAQFVQDTLFLYGDADSGAQAARAIAIAHAFFRRDDNGWNHATLEEDRSLARRPTAETPVWGQFQLVDLTRVRPRDAARNGIVEE